MDLSNCIKVINIPMQATAQEIEDFFSSSGQVDKLQLSSLYGEETQTAYVTFKDELAMKSAILLSGSLLLDKEVKISTLEAAIDDQNERKGAIGRAQDAMKMLTNWRPWIKTTNNDSHVATPEWSKNVQRHVAAINDRFQIGQRVSSTAQRCLSTGNALVSGALTRVRPTSSPGNGDQSSCASSSPKGKNTVQLTELSTFSSKTENHCEG